MTHARGAHERFLQHFEFDACELSFSSHVVAMDQGMPVHAVQIFPRRLFSQPRMYKNLTSGINRPKDLWKRRFRSIFSLLSGKSSRHLMREMTKYIVVR